MGLFLSTGLFGGGSNTQNKLLDCAEILRGKLRYPGYLHLKLMPGIEFGQVQRAMQLADRVSINLEAPNPKRLGQIAPEKKFAEELFAPLRWAAQIQREQPPSQTHNGRWASTSTQFVVGAAGESDLEILGTTEKLFKQLAVRRTYFEAFSPIPGTPLEHQPAEDPTRQQRLYEASYLLRDYGFDLEELSFDPDGHLPLNIDPKQGYAEMHLAHAPIELNRAERAHLLKVPGIGPVTSERILQTRSETRLVDLGQLRRIGIAAERAAPYILLDGRSPIRQLPLFAVEKTIA
jgi:predicted DNA-binding helix-hairpin-helix protein